MDYDELKEEVKNFEEEFGLIDVVYLEIIKKLENLEIKELDETTARRLIGSFLIIYGMRRNVGRKDFDWSILTKNVRNLRLDKIRGKDLLTTDFDDEEISERIIGIYKKLRMRNLSATGVSKVMHLLIPELFVMWDDEIQKNVCKKRRFSASSKGYLNFLKWIQNELVEAMDGHTVTELRNEIPSEVTSKTYDEKYIDKKTLAKLADEYCFAKAHSLGSSSAR